MLHSFGFELYQIVLWIVSLQIRSPKSQDGTALLCLLYLVVDEEAVERVQLKSFLAPQIRENVVSEIVNFEKSPLIQILAGLETHFALRVEQHSL